MNPATLKLERARWWVLSNQPFYGALAMRLTDTLDPSLPTAATNGRSIRWNPAWVESLTDEEVRFVLLHETLHCAHQHLWRLPHDQRGNVAGDHEINLTLQDIDGISMPDGGLADPQYRGLACEEILGRLPEQPQGKQGGSGSGQGDACGAFEAPADPGQDPGQDGQGQGQSSQQLRDDWQTAVVQAAQVGQCTQAGTLPGDLARELDRLRAPAIDWRRELADFVKQAVGSRNDWSRAARRHAWQRVIYPRRMADSLGLVVFARDTSGSVTDRDCAESSALITDCLLEVGCAGLVIDCDTDVRAEYELAPGDVCPLTAKGGGGTRFQPVFDRVAQLQEDGTPVAGIVYLTDLEGPDPKPTDIPTLWLVTSDERAPFGRSVRIR